MKLYKPPVEYYENYRLVNGNLFKKSKLWKNHDYIYKTIGEISIKVFYTITDGKINNQVYILYKSHNCITVKMYNNGKLHGIDDTPAIIKYHRGENQFVKEWYKNNKLHRDNDKPAILIISTYNQFVKKWYKNGKLHRTNNKPAIEIKSMYGYSTKTWYKNGNLFNAVGPIRIEYNDETLSDEEWAITYKYDNSLYEYKYNKYYPHLCNQIHTVSYYKKIGRLQFVHRQNGPAHITYYKNGAIKCIEWQYYGKFYRKGNKPAKINYNQNGAIVKQYKGCKIKPVPRYYTYNEYFKQHESLTNKLPK